VVFRSLVCASNSRFASLNAPLAVSVNCSLLSHKVKSESFVVYDLLMFHD
jgi:hypothetical protein